MHPLTSQDS